jgi:Ner family transcriptional regulator
MNKKLNPTSLSGGHPELVKAAVRMRGKTLTGLALQNGLSESCLRMTLLKPIPRGEQVIAAFLGIPAHLIWPNRYNSDGTPNHAKWRSLHASKFKKRRAA